MMKNERKKLFGVVAKFSSKRNNGCIDSGERRRRRRRLRNGFLLRNYRRSPKNRLDSSVSKEDNRGREGRASRNHFAVNAKGAEKGLRIFE